MTDALSGDIRALPHRPKWDDIKSAPIYTALTIALASDPLDVGVHLPNAARTPRKRPPRKVTAKPTRKPLDKERAQEDSSR